MSVVPGDSPVEIDIDPAIFQSFADLEKDFAKVELDALRRKEFDLKPLYTKRSTLSSRIPDFWPAVLMNGPQEFQSILSETSIDTLSAIKSITVERHRVKSETEGDPRSLRFTFEFAANEWFEDTKVVKEFEFVEGRVGPGGLISKPMSFRWKKKGKKLNGGLLDLAVDLYRAEEAVKLKDGASGKDLGAVERESLWQYEKLRSRLEELAQDEDGPMPCWLDWFGYRGVIDPTAAQHAKSDDDEDDDAEENDDDEGLVEIEIFPPGEEVANALADDLWPNVMDYFMASQQEPLMEDLDGLESDDDEEAEDDEAPELVEIEEPAARPAKRQRQA